MLSCISRFWLNIFESVMLELCELHNWNVICCPCIYNYVYGQAFVVSIWNLRIFYSSYLVLCEILIDFVAIFSLIVFLLWFWIRIGMYILSVRPRGCACTSIWWFFLLFVEILFPITTSSCVRFLWFLVPIFLFHFVFGFGLTQLSWERSLAIFSNSELFSHFRVWSIYVGFACSCLGKDHWLDFQIQSFSPVFEFGCFV